MLTCVERYTYAHNKLLQDVSTKNLRSNGFLTDGYTFVRAQVIQVHANTARDWEQLFNSDL